MNINSRKSLFSWILKFLIIGASFWIIYTEVFKREDAGHYFSDFADLIQTSHFLNLFLPVIFLMFANWFIESMKWRMLVRKVEEITALQAVEAVLTGITISFFTPNRIGEYAGRVFYLKKADRIKASIIAVIGSLGQMLITLLFGGLALIYYFYYIVPLDGFLAATISSLVLILIVLAFIWYFNLTLFTSNIVKWKVFKNIKQYPEVLGYYSGRELLSVILFSVARYLIFTTQYFLLLRALNVDLDFLAGFMMISMVFFVVTAVPTIALTELGIRGATAIYFIGLLSTDHFGILMSSFLLWMINLVVPASIGAVLVLNFKIFRK